MNDATPQRITELALLIEAMPGDPTASRRLADAALIHGLAHSDRLSLAALAVVERVTELDDGAVTELASVLAAEQERRRHAAMSACVSLGSLCGRDGGP